MFILTVAAGAVPIAYRLADGNTTDDPTHVPTWVGLVSLLGRADFLTRRLQAVLAWALGHIAAGGGLFVSVLPRSRGVVRWFRDWAQTHLPVWTVAVFPRRAGRSPSRCLDLPRPSALRGGYRVFWCTPAPCRRVAASRQARIEAGAAAIVALAARCPS